MTDAVSSSSDFHVRGLVVPIVTPYTPHGAVDLHQAQALAAFYASQDVPALFPGGTTGEFALLTLEEREALLEAVVRGVQASGSVVTQIIAHTGAATLEEVLRLSRHALGLGVPAVAVVTPFLLWIRGNCATGLLSGGVPGPAATRGLRLHHSATRWQFFVGHQSGRTGP